MPEDMPNRMPEDMPDRMPEDMSDRMPEDLPVTKCIHVMVGITRSKVILKNAVAQSTLCSGLLSFQKVSRPHRPQVLHILQYQYYKYCPKNMF